MLALLGALWAQRFMQKDVKQVKGGDKMLACVQKPVFPSSKGLPEFDNHEPFLTLHT